MLIDMSRYAQVCLKSTLNDMFLEKNRLKIDYLENIKVKYAFNKISDFSWAY